MGTVSSSTVLHRGKVSLDFGMTFMCEFCTSAAATHFLLSEIIVDDIVHDPSAKDEKGHNQ